MSNDLFYALTQTSVACVSIRHSTSMASFNHLSKSPVDEPTPGCPTEAHEEEYQSPEPLFHNLQGP
jgi:hypothetical protein